MNFCLLVFSIQLMIFVWVCRYQQHTHNLVLHVRTAFYQCQFILKLLLLFTLCDLRMFAEDLQGDIYNSSPGVSILFLFSHSLAHTANISLCLENSDLSSLGLRHWLCCLTQQERTEEATHFIALVLGISSSEVTLNLISTQVFSQ